MEMRIVVPDSASAGALAERLTLVFGARRVSFASREVEVEVERESDGAVLRVLETVEHWLDRADIGAAEMWLGDHPYRIARWVPVPTEQ